MFTWITSQPASRWIWWIGRQASELESWKEKKKKVAASSISIEFVIFIQIDLFGRISFSFPSPFTWYYCVLWEAQKLMRTKKNYKTFKIFWPLKVQQWLSLSWLPLLFSWQRWEWHFDWQAFELKCRESQKRTQFNRFCLAAHQRVFPLSGNFRNPIRVAALLARWILGLTLEASFILE